MKSQTSYQWNGHIINLCARASAKYLWLDYRLDVEVDGKHSDARSSWNLLSSSTQFKVNHEGKNAYGEIVSSGFPCTPIVTQATIMNDSIIGHCQLWIRDRWLTYGILATAMASFLYL